MKTKEREKRERMLVNKYFQKEKCIKGFSNAKLTADCEKFGRKAYELGTDLGRQPLWETLSERKGKKQGRSWGEIIDQERIFLGGRNTAYVFIDGNIPVESKEVKT